MSLCRGCRGSVAVLAVLAATSSAAAPSPSPSLYASFGVAPEPWLPLNGGSFSGPPAPASPDPLVSYVWPLATTNDTLLQIFSVPAVAIGPAAGTPPTSFLNLSSAIGSVACNIHVAGNGSIVIDFGVELPAWLEFDSPNLLAADAQGIVLGISEYTSVDWVGGFKQAAPTVYGTGCGAALCTYRLETNSELYEGVRYGFLGLVHAPSRAFTITGLRAVSQAKAMNYVGSFHSAGDPMLEKVWYAAAYTVRATAQSTYMGSILMDRGDRFSWTGDAHPSQATAMAAFGNFAFVLNNLNRSKGDCQGIATYCLYFVLSVSDYYKATGDAASVAYLTPNVADHLDGAIGQWEEPTGLRFVGWDDRTGAGFANHTTPETQILYRLLAIRAWSAAGAFFGKTGNALLSAKYLQLAANRSRDIRSMGSGGPWTAQLGLHAGSDAVNAGILTADEKVAIAAGPIGDIVKLPSQSNFNQYFILQALSGLGQLDRGVESVRAIWGPIVGLGATTFWETSHPSAFSIMPPGPPPPPAEQSGWVSLCHPWSSGPTPWLTAWVLGVRPLEPGFITVLIAPHVAHSMEGVSGRAATPHGAITLTATRGLEASLDLTLPEGVHAATVRLSAVLLARLGLPIAADVSAEALRDLLVDLDGANAAAVTRIADGDDASEAPLIDESDMRRGRARSLELTLAGGRSYQLRVRLAVPAPLAPWAPRGSPFPPPAWPGQFVNADATTQGSWLGKYGHDGYLLLGYDLPSATGADPFCGVEGEGSSLQLLCLEPSATMSIRFASFGSATGTCPNFAVGSCNAAQSMAVVTAACAGKNSCSVDVNNDAFGGDPCVGTPKTLSVVAHCSTGGGIQPGSGSPPKDRLQLPAYVTSARVVDYDGYCGARGNWVNASLDPRALQDPAGGSRRALGFTQPCGCPTSPVDILLTDAAKAAGKRYRLSLYFVDWAPSPTCSSLAGSARTQETYILSGYPDLSPLTERQFLTSFSQGLWLSYDLVGDARVRISTATGDYAVLSALAFDPAPEG